jgi:hypothetical protein
MVDQASLGQVNERLSASGSHLRVAVVPLSECDYLEKNARYMPVEQYRRLVENIRSDGALTSVPFAVRRDGRYLILSGNHRVRAAGDAGLSDVLLLFTEADLSRQQQVAIQISHNALVGQDDLAILRELFDELDDVTLRGYSGLDDATLGRMEPPKLEPLSDAQLEYRIVSIGFLPHEADRAEALFKRVLEEAQGDALWVNRYAEYDRLLDALTLAKEQAGVKNTATAFMLLLDIAERHLDELPRREPRAKKSDPSAQ